MSALQQTLISIQSKTPPSALICRSFLTPKPRSLSFSGSVPSLRLSRGGGFVCMSGTAANSYATALADLATENNALDATCADIEKLEQIFRGDPEVVEFFADPTVDEDEKRSLIDKVAEAAGLQQHTVNLLYLLVDERRMDEVEEVVKEFEVVYNEMTDTELAVVTSVVPLESQHLAQIAKQVQKLTGSKNVRIKSLIDPSLVAGFTIQYGLDGSKLIDMSVKKQLEEIASGLVLDDLELSA